MLNNVIITNESNVNRSSLINYILDNSYSDSTSPIEIFQKLVLMN